MKSDGISVKERLYDIFSMRTIAKQLLGQGKPYEKLLKIILAKDYVYNYEIESPSIKELSEMTGIKYDKVRKQINMIYDDLYNQEDTCIKFSINKVKYTFSLHSLGENAYITFDHIPILPRVGESISIPYFREKVKSSRFHVANITHIYSDKELKVLITCKGGSYNKYWHIRKDEALAKGEISLRESFSYNEYDIKRRLGLDPYF